MDNFESNFFIYFFKFFPPVLTICILPNSSDRLIFVKRQAKDGRYFIKNTSVRQAKFKFSATKNFNFAKKIEQLVSEGTIDENIEEESFLEHHVGHLFSCNSQD